MSPPVLVADCVSKSFGARRVLSAGSLRAESGQVRVLFGRNGIGKSTLLKIAAGVITADSGTVHVNGEALLLGSKLDAKNLETRRRVGYMSQAFSLYGELSVRQNLEFFAGVYGLTGARRADRVATMIDVFELGPMAGRNAGGRVAHGGLPRHRTRARSPAAGAAARAPRPLRILDQRWPTGRGRGRGSGLDAN